MENKLSDKKIKTNSFDKILEENSKGYTESKNSQEENDKSLIELDENLFSNAINFSHFNNEFLSINLNKFNNENNRNNFLNPIEENDFEENNIIENYENHDIKTNDKKIFKESQLNNPSIFINTNSKIENHLNYDQIQNINISLTKKEKSVEKENNKNIYDFLSLNNLNLKLSKDNFIQKELSLLNENFLKNDNKKNKKGLKYDKDIYIDFVQIFSNFLTQDLKTNLNVDEFSYKELMKKRIFNENVKLILIYY